MSQSAAATEMCPNDQTGSGGIFSSHLDDVTVPDVPLLELTQLFPVLVSLRAHLVHHALPTLQLLQEQRSSFQFTFQNDL